MSSKPMVARNIHKPECVECIDSSITYEHERKLEQPLVEVKHKPSAPIVSLAERWLPLGEFPGYEISDRGRIRNGNGRIMRAGRAGWQRRYRYFVARVKGRQKSRSISRLVLLTFRGEPPTPKHEARHLNGIHDDDRLNNLVWGTKSENERDKRKHGTWWRTGKQKLKPDDIRRIFALYSAGHTQVEIGKKMGVSGVQISRILRGKTWTLLEDSQELVEAVAGITYNQRKHV